MRLSPRDTVPDVSAHYKEPFHGQRIAKLPRRLRRLGALDLPRDGSLLDACCGKGEALAILRESGFTRLSGADAVYHEEWRDARSTRFVACDVRRLPFAARSFDTVLNLHALHHMGGVEGSAAFLAECHRVLRPGGQLLLLDFPASLQIRAAFWSLRARITAVTPGLTNFADILDEEWPYVSAYLRHWSQVKRLIEDGQFSIVRRVQELFYFYLTLRRP